MRLNRNNIKFLLGLQGNNSPIYKTSYSNMPVGSKNIVLIVTDEELSGFVQHFDSPAL